MNKTLNMNSGFSSINSVHELGDNYVYNATEVREIHTVANYKNADKGKSVVIEGFQCIGECVSEIDDPEGPDGECEEGRVQKWWTDVSNWELQLGEARLPEAGDSIQIYKCWHMLLNIEETPELDYIEINGILEFQNDQVDRHLHAKHIFVRAGELRIGE